MICAFSGDKPYPCGRCWACRQNNARKWLLRLLCEGKLHEQTPIFLTMTYRPEDEPKCLGTDGNQLGNLNPSHLSDYLHRLRRRVVETTPGHTSETPNPVRYYACGEYGKATGRPHYHAILFGDSVRTSLHVQTLWPHGFVLAKPATPVNMAYTLKYVLKDLAAQSPSETQQAPFNRMSLRPPLGVGYAKNIATSLTALMGRDQGPSPLGLLGNLPPILRMDGRMLPMDRIMKRYVTDALVDQGMPETLIDSVFPAQEVQTDGKALRQAKLKHQQAWHNRNRTKTLHL